MEGDILEVMDKMSAEDRARASRTLEEFELKALAEMKIMPGVAELAAFLDDAAIPRALITRNVLTSVEHFHGHVLGGLRPFSPALARCFRPYKPFPDSIHHVCKQWNVRAENAVMVGDSAKDDIVCGNRAGSHTILIDFKREIDKARLPAEQQPTFHVHSMHEVAQVLREHFDLRAPAAGPKLHVSA